MESTLYTEITLPHPDVSSPNFLEQRDNLDNALAEIIESMCQRLSQWTGLDIIDLQNDIDDIKLDQDDRQEISENKYRRRRDRGRNPGNAKAGHRRRDYKATKKTSN